MQAAVTDPKNVLSVMRQKAQDEILRPLGLAATPRRFAPGTPLDGDVDRKRVHARQAVADMPVFHEVAQHAAARIQAEERVDYVIDARDLRMNEEAHLVLASGNAPWTAPLLQEHRGLYLLLARLSPAVFNRSFETLRRLTPAVRAAAFNDLMKRLGPSLVHWNGKRYGQPKRLKLRTRRTHRVGGHRAVFATVSSSYPTNYDGDHYLLDVAQHVQAVCPDTRGTVIYDPWTTRVRFDVVWNEENVVDYSVGDVFRLVLSGSTRDDAGARYRMWAGALRESGALFAVDHDKAQLLARIHRGKAANVVDEISGAITKGVSVYSTFLEEWGQLSGVGIEGVALFGKTFTSVPDALGYLVKSGRVDLGLGDDPATLKALLDIWGTAPGAGATHMLTTIAQAAQSAASSAHAEATESLAASLMGSMEAG